MEPVSSFVQARIAQVRAIAQNLVGQPVEFVFALPVCEYNFVVSEEAAMQLDECTTNLVTFVLQNEVIFRQSPEDAQVGLAAAQRSIMGNQIETAVQELVAAPEGGIDRGSSTPASANSPCCSCVVL